MAARALPDVSDFPIPRDVAPGPGWSAQMREMADCIGAYETLLISDRHGGQEFYIPADAGKNPFRPLIGAAKAKALSWVFRRATIIVPTAGYALRRARRAPIVASVRAGEISVTEASLILKVRRDYMAKLLNRTDEGREVMPAGIGKPRHDPRQLDMFG